MAAVVKNGYLIAVTSEDFEDLLARRIRKELEAAQPLLLGVPDNVLEPPEFLGQVSKIARTPLIVGESQHDNR